MGDGVGNCGLRYADRRFRSGATGTGAWVCFGIVTALDAMALLASALMLGLIAEHFEEILVGGSRSAGRIYGAIGAFGATVIGGAQLLVQGPLNLVLLLACRRIRMRVRLVAVAVFLAGMAMSTAGYFLVWHAGRARA